MNTSPSTLIRSLAVGAIALGTTGALFAAAPAADAASRAPVSVTIQAEGVDLSGTVVSNRDACMDERKVVVWKQVGKRGGEDDVKFASDTTEIVDGVGQWSTGNTGTEGKFYATVKRSPLCKAASSPTIKAVRND
jgi:hypothetical protein